MLGKFGDFRVTFISSKIVTLYMYALFALGARIVYIPCGMKFCGSLFLQIGDFLCFAGTNIIVAIRTDWLFLLEINFCYFQKVPSMHH